MVKHITYIFHKLYNLYIKRRFLKFEGHILNPHQIMGEKYISIGKDTIIGKDIILTAWDKYEDETFTPSIEIGENCLIGEHAHITACYKIKIGNNILTGRYIYISDNAHGTNQKEELEIPPIKRKLHVIGPVIIDDNVWIGE